MSGIIVQCMAKMQLGGAQKRVIELMHESGERGLLITGKGGELYKIVRKDFGERHITLKYLEREINPVYDFLCLLELRRVLINEHRKWGDVILHTHGSKAGVLGRIVCGMLPFCFSIHTIHGFAINPYISPFKRFLYLNAERIASLPGNVIITQVESHIERARDWGIGKRKKFIYIPNYIKLNPFLKIKRSREAKEGIVVGTIGNFKPQKNPLVWAEVALTIVDNYPGAIFRYIGDGPLKKEVIRRVANKERIEISGWRSDIIEQLKKMDIFFLPSRWEGLPRTVLEAMSAGLPVVASNVDGTPEAVRDGVNGYLLEPDDVRGYIKKLSELIEDPDKRFVMGKKGREIVKSKFSYKKNMQITLGLYGRILKNQKII